MVSSGGGRVMAEIKPSAAAAAASSQVVEQQQQMRAVLRCPRCDSSNTKFCYYNNYSLSQPRHFCKACKRYWTRGGTLRNVPVGGGCRKNKRLKKPTPNSSSSDHTINAATTPTPQTHHQIQVSKAVSSNHHHHQLNSSLFYSLPNQLSDHVNNLTSIPRLFHSNSSTTATYDLQPQFNTLGLGSFSSSTNHLTGGGGGGAIDHNHDDDYRNGFNPTTQIRDVITSNSLLSNFSLLGSTSSSTTTTTSLLASSLQHQKLNWGGLMKETSRVPSCSTSHFLQDLSSPFEGLQMVGNSSSSSDPRMVVKGVKIEEGKNINKVDWNAPFENNSSMDQLPINGPSDSSLYWNSLTVGGAWSDLSNYGSSVTPLI